MIYIDKNLDIYLVGVRLFSGGKYFLRIFSLIDLRFALGISSLKKVTFESKRNVMGGGAEKELVLLVMPIGRIQS